MSRGDLQEMEVKTQQSSTAVNSGAAKGDPMPTTPNYVPDGQGSVEDLGGPTPENSKPDDNSNMLKTPTATIKQVKDVITKNAGKADPMPTAPKYAEEAEADESQEVVAEEESTEATETETEAVDLNAAIEEDVNALLSGEDLSEEFKEKAKTIPDTSGRTSTTSSEQLDLFDVSSKTSKDTSLSDSEKLSKTWKDLISKRRGEYLARVKSAHRTKENESLSWPTPTLHGNYNRKGASQNSGDGLETAVKKELWPTPTASAYKGSGPTNIRKDGKDRKRSRLDYAVEQKSGTLNPPFVEWLMGLKIGLTDLDSWVTELSPKQPPEHGRS